ncbi:MAG TPA: RNA polymerase sigma factor [Planctomycetota bacterium]|nr:RNA polymerase sigma factor [Planctomycetota bacterium]
MNDDQSQEPLASEIQGSAEDDALIEAIAERADKDAFAELYERFNNPAFNLALYLTRDRTLAEDAVQEAMLRIWVSAKSYTPGNPRGWILRIVARESLHKLKAQKKRSRRMETRPSSETEEQDDPSAHSEVVPALRAVLDKLPDDDQQLVALHFGAGLSLREMSAELSVPRQTLHNKIMRILAALKGQLAAGGFSAAIPFVRPDSLSEVLTSGQSCPAGLSEMVLSQLGTTSQLPALSEQSTRSARVSKLGTAKSTNAGAGTLGPLFIATATLTLAAGGWYALSSAPKQAPLVTPAPAALAPVATPPAPVPAVVPFNFTWSALNEPATQFKVIGGGWTWRGPQGNQPGAMALLTPTFIAQVPVNAPSRPFVVVLNVRNLKDIANVEATWCEETAIPAFEHFTVKDPPVQPKGFEVHVHFKDNYSISYFNKTPITIRKFDKPYPAAQIVLSLKNIELVSLVARDLLPGEQSNYGEEPEQVLARLKAQPGKITIGKSERVDFSHIKHTVTGNVK